jgi:recombination protein RecA
MANHALATLETALRARKLDRTLTTSLPPLERHDGSALIATDVAALDVCLRGGLPRGQLSEIVGPRSSGRSSLVLQTMAAATRRGEIAALVDTFDRLDVASAADAGIDLDRLLWIRGTWGPASAGPDAFINRALKALNLVLRAGGFACVVIDLADAPLAALKRMPFTTWLRVQRVIEGSDTACVLVAPQPLARSAGGLTLMLTGRARWTGDADRNRHLTGADLSVRVVSPRRRVDGDLSLRIGH